MATGAIAGLRVVEMCGWNGVLAGRLLADAGADVVRVVGSNDPIRLMEPRTGTHGVSLQDAWYNAGKRLMAAPQPEVLADLLRGADVLVHDGEADALDSERLAEFRDRGLVQVTVSPFGLSGPWASYRAPDIVANAMSGSASVTGDAATGPLNGYGNQSYHTVGLYAAVCAMVGIVSRRHTGRGMHIDLSAHEALASCTEQVLMQWFFPEGGPWRSRIAERLGSLHWSRAYEVYGDRHGEGLMVTASLRPLDVLVPWLDETGEADDLADSTRYPSVIDLVRDLPHVMEVLKRWVGNHDADELFFEAQRRHQPFGAVWDIPKAVASPQLQSRGYFQDVPVAGGRTIPFPGRFFRTSADGEHPRPPLAMSSTSAGWDERPSPAQQAQPAARGPLEGIRVLDFTHVLAGPFGTRLLGDLGAEVIKVGSAKRGGGANSTAHPYYLSWNRNKRSINLDMSTAAARDIARKIAVKSDVVIDNFSNGVLARWGLDYRSLAPANPRVTSIAMGGMGKDGPWQDFVTFAPTIHALVGLTYLTGVPGRNDLGYGFSLTDHLSGLAAALAALEGVEHASRTGAGLEVDLSQYELGMGLMAPACLDYFVNSRSPLPPGNAPAFGNDAPHGIYPCAGDDAWIAIVCSIDEEWRAAATVLGLDPSESGWADHATRVADRARLDAKVAVATKHRERFALMEALQAVGVAAGPVMTAQDLVESDPQMAARDFFGTAESERFGTYGLDRFPAIFDGVRPARYDGPVANGADTYDVLSTLLELDDETIAGLMAEGALT